MNNNKIERIMAQLEKEGYTKRRINNAIAKEEKREVELRTQKTVQSITISIEWKKSQTWGYCPHCEASVYYTDNTFTRSTVYKASGCGYDKESTVIAQVFNEYLRYTLYNREDKDNSKAPYGISLDYDYTPYFEGGVGTNCYYNISEFIGGKFERLASGKSYDTYKFTMNE